MQINRNIKNAQMDKLFEAILEIKNADECYAFFEDLCTISELQAMAQRIEVAALLRDGVTYNDIAERTKASTATISRVNKCLQYGTGGYRLILERVESEKP
ncbi:MAG: YerC/YecD family TrpR-related protein [Christensenellales bacterium]|jgi:TrpR-related protein YerC/YecD